MIFKQSSRCCKTWWAYASKTECVLYLGGNFAVLCHEPVFLSEVLHPALIEGNEDVISGLQNPANTTLPAEIARLVVVLNQVRKRQEGRSGIVHLPGQYPCDEVPLR